MAAQDNDMLFYKRKEVEDSNKRHLAAKKAQCERIKGLIKEHRPVSKFSIHGVVIEAKSRKDAIKIYNKRKESEV